MRCLTDLLSSNLTVLWSLPPQIDERECLQASPLFCVPQHFWPNVEYLSNIGVITFTTRQFRNHIGFQITGE